MAEESVRRRKAVPAGASEPDGGGGIMGVANKHSQRQRSWEAIIVAVACFILVRLAIKIFVRYDLLGVGLG